MPFRQFVLALIATVAPFLPGSLFAGDGLPSGPNAETRERTVAKGIAFLKASQARDGSYSSRAGIGVTALVTTALMQNGVPASDPQVALSLNYLKAHRKLDGGIYQTGSHYRNYETCLSILCFSKANTDGQFDEVIQRADAFLAGLQWDEQEGKGIADVEYGGAGYGRHNRPDLSNTAFLIEALRAAGNNENSTAMQRALIFVSRCQNLESAHNTTPFSAKVRDGGLYYTPAAGGSSQAGETSNGGLRSYGSMTYAGLKSMIYAGVRPDDPRVRAALQWAQRHYTLKANPGMGDAGLYYYYHIFAKTMAATGDATIKDAAGAVHDWRAELFAELAARQQKNGSWINENSKWLEGDANLVTAYAMLALTYCGPHADSGSSK